MWKIEHTPCCSTWIRWLLLNEFRYFPCMTSKYWHCPWQIWQPLIDMRLNRLELVPPISAPCAYVINFKCCAMESGWDSPRHNCQACRLSPVRTASLVLRPSAEPSTIQLSAWFRFMPPMFSPLFCLANIQNVCVDSSPGALHELLLPLLRTNTMPKLMMAAWRWAGADVRVGFVSCKAFKDARPTYMCTEKNRDYKYLIYSILIFW